MIPEALRSRVIPFPKNPREKRKKKTTPLHRYTCGALELVCPNGFAINIDDYAERYIKPAMKHAVENG